ncbi:hypothetical protein PENDEC_c032G03973 [Penicillium decumbens]|uniref:Uncharacterized protein n=1 Tax=Penicillium decumbens TaxID=69771 RepID=A0A1V6NV93_PENDC|nr:hypothetical protein PENDEC_c032G03973 [Penicillium decumbens]
MSDQNPQRTLRSHMKGDGKFKPEPPQMGYFETKRANKGNDKEVMKEAKKEVKKEDKKEKKKTAK